MGVPVGGDVPTSTCVPVVPHGHPWNYSNIKIGSYLVLSETKMACLLLKNQRHIICFLLLHRKLVGPARFSCGHLNKALLEWWW